MRLRSDARRPVVVDAGAQSPSPRRPTMGLMLKRKQAERTQRAQKKWKKEATEEAPNKAPKTAKKKARAETSEADPPAGVFERTAALRDPAQAKR